MAWGLEGRQLSVGWALALCQHVGFRGKNLTNAVALMTAESGRYTRAWHENLITTNGGPSYVDSVDHGLFQINDKWHPDLENANDPVSNASYAFDMSSGGEHFGAWAAYDSGAYKKYVPVVWAIRHLTLWRGKVHRVAKGELSS